MDRYRPKIYAAMLVFFFFGILLSVKIVNTKATVFKKENETLVMIRSILPQAWGFFTRNPREASLLVFQEDGAEFIPIDFIAKRRQSAFNVHRNTRFLAREMGRLMEQIKVKDWKPCKGKSAICGRALEPLNLKNPTRLAELCGSFLFVQQEIVPWAWSNNNRSIEMPSQVVRIAVSCHDGGNHG